MAETGKKVLFITYDGLSDPLGQSQIIPYYKGLQAKGHQITILSCEKQAAFQEKGESIQKDLEKHKINWVSVKYHKNPPIISTFFDLLRLKKQAFDLNKKQNFDIVHCRTILTAGIGLKLKAKGPKFIFDFRGFWTDERVDGKLWPQHNPVYRVLYSYFKRREIKAYNQADQLISLTENAKGFLKERFNISGEKVAVVPCSVDLNHFDYSKVDDSKQQSLKKNLKLENAYPILAYAGSLGTRYLSHEMIDCFVQIQKKYNQAHYLIISNSDTKELMNYAESKGVADHMRFISTSYQQIPDYLSLAQLALYFIYPGNSGRAVSPTKQAEFLSMGVPIISNDGIGDTSKIVNLEKVGCIVEKLEDSAYQSLVGRIDELLEISPAQLREVAKKYFALSKGIDTYHKVYQKL